MAKTRKTAEWMRVLTLGAALAAGYLLRTLERSFDSPASPTALQAEQLTAAAGQGGLLSVLGGLRSMLANGCWLRTNLAWEKSDVAATTALIELTVASDERPLYFWLNGARMLASDVTEWRLAGPVPASFRARVTEEQAQVALQFLEKGIRWRGTDPALYVEMANIHLRRRGDLESAARFYRLAAEQPHAPYYAARIHGELLRQLGHRTEALAWLKKILPGLPATDPEARRTDVVERIAALERELNFYPVDAF